MPSRKNVFTFERGTGVEMRLLLCRCQAHGPGHPKNKRLVEKPQKDACSASREYCEQQPGIKCKTLGSGVMRYQVSIVPWDYSGSMGSSVV